MANTKSNQGSSAVKIAAIGAGIASLAATTYFFLGPKGKKHLHNAKAWAIKMKGDVIEKLETAVEVSEPVYHKIIDSVASEYTKGMKATKDEISELATDLKKHWKTISGHKKAAKKSVKVVGKKVAKK